MKILLEVHNEYGGTLKFEVIQKILRGAFAARAMVWTATVRHG